MSTPTRTISRRTAHPYRGRPIVLIVPPRCDYISLRLAGTRKLFDVDLASVYHLAVRRYVAAKKGKRK